MKKIFPKSEYARNSIISVAGVGIASLIPLALAPVLGRIYTPEEVNTMGLFFSVSSMLAVAVNLRYAQAVAVADTDEDARNLVVGSMWLSMLSSVLLYLILLVGVEYIGELAKIPDADFYWLYLVPLSTFLISVCIALTGWLNRKKAFTGMAVNKIVRRGGEGIFQLVLGKLGFSFGYTVGTFLGDVTNFVVHLFQFRRTAGYFQKPDFSKISQTLKRYSNFPKHNLAPALLDTISLYLPYMYVNAYFADDISGQFFQCTQVLGFPIALIAATISQVLLQKLTENKQQSKPVSAIVKKHFLVLGLMALAGILILAFFGELVFVVFLGDQWVLAGQMSSVLVLGYAVKFAITPLSIIFFSHQELRMVSYWQYLRFGLIAAVFLLEGLTIWQFIWINVIIEVILYAIYLIMIFSLANRYDRSLNSTE